ncbi:MAG: twin-arginine translocase TatA/TatE family subunit [Bacillota bacterium]
MFGRLGLMEILLILVLLLLLLSPKKLPQLFQAIRESARSLKGAASASEEEKQES